MSLRQRYTSFTIGVIFTALGIALITKAGLGTSAISSPAYVLSFIFPLSFGTFTFLISAVMLLAQIAVLKKNFPVIQLLQVPAGLLMGILLDVYIWLLSSWEVEHYVARILVLILGCAVLGMGISFQVTGDVLMLPSEGLVRVLAQRTGWEFGRMKTCFDISLVVFSLIVSLVFLHGIYGVREGTLIAAMSTGFYSRFFQKYAAGLWKRTVVIR